MSGAPTSHRIRCLSRSKSCEVGIICSTWSCNISCVSCKRDFALLAFMIVMRATLWDLHLHSHERVWFHPRPRLIAGLGLVLLRWKQMCAISCQSCQGFGRFTLFCFIIRTLYESKEVYLSLPRAFALSHPSFHFYRKDFRGRSWSELLIWEREIRPKLQQILEPERVNEASGKVEPSHACIIQSVSQNESLCIFNISRGIVTRPK